MLAQAQRTTWILLESINKIDFPVFKHPQAILFQMILTWLLFVMDCLIIPLLKSTILIPKGYLPLYQISTYWKLKAENTFSVFLISVFKAIVKQKHSALTTLSLTFCTPVLVIPEEQKILK